MKRERKKTSCTRTLKVPWRLLPALPSSGTQRKMERKEWPHDRVRPERERACGALSSTIGAGGVRTPAASRLAVI